MQLATCIQAAPFIGIIIYICLQVNFTIQWHAIYSIFIVMLLLPPGGRCTWIQSAYAFMNNHSSSQSYQIRCSCLRWDLLISLGVLFLAVPLNILALSPSLLLCIPPKCPHAERPYNPSFNPILHQTIVLRNHNNIPLAQTTNQQKCLHQH